MDNIITEQEYNKYCEHLEVIIGLIDNDALESDPLLQELLHIANNIEVY